MNGGKSHNSVRTVGQAHTHKSLTVGTSNRGHARSVGRTLPSKSNHHSFSDKMENKINELEDKFRHTNFNYK